MLCYSCKSKRRQRAGPHDEDEEEDDDENENAELGTSRDEEDGLEARDGEDDAAGESGNQSFEGLNHLSDHVRAS